MSDLRQTLEDWRQSAVAGMAQLGLAPRVEQVGHVMSVGDGIAVIAGLPDAKAEELLFFPHGLVGIALHLGAESIGCVLLGRDDLLSADDVVHGSGMTMRVPVGETLLGRVIDPTGIVLDDGPPIGPRRFDALDRPAPEISERDSVTEPLHTGTLVIDSMFPLGRGQRELIVGDRQTGKTALAVGAILSQKNEDVICVYVAVGQRASNTLQVIEAVRRNGRFERSIFVVAPTDSPPGLQWIAPAAAMTIAEFFRDKGRHVLIVIDDLTKHAAIHRELSLLLRHPPGREAYPGDIFFVHARLLERAAKMSREKGGGSISALPIAETQAGNLSAYIPTNLISITDGQIVLDARLFRDGQKPAVDVGRSVSRVGGAAQPKSLRRLAAMLRLDYAQFLELEIFTHFGMMVEERTRKTIEHGRRLRALLTQPPAPPRSRAIEIALLAAAASHAIDELATEKMTALIGALETWLAGAGAPLAQRLDAGDLLTDEEQRLLDLGLGRIVKELAA